MLHICNLLILRLIRCSSNYELTANTIATIIIEKGKDVTEKGDAKQTRLSFNRTRNLQKTIFMSKNPLNLCI